jgi:hypothetical protein
MPSLLELSGALKLAKTFSTPHANAKRAASYSQSVHVVVCTMERAAVKAWHRGNVDPECDVQCTKLLHQLLGEMGVVMPEGSDHTLLGALGSARANWRQQQARGLNKSQVLYGSKATPKLR